jgi:hypothetical protein
MAAIELDPIPPNPLHARYLVQRLNNPQHYVFCCELEYARRLTAFNGEPVIIRNTHTGKVVK